MGRVVIMAGCSGSGKSSYIAKHFPSAYVVSADHFFMRDGEYEFNRSQLHQAHSQCQTNYLDALTSGVELIVVDNTNTRLKEMRPYIEPALELGYEVEIVVLLVNVRKAFKRNKHGVPLAVIEKMAARLDNTLTLLPPEWPHTIIYDENK